jgi:hypothetical protein
VTILGPGLFTTVIGHGLPCWVLCVKREDRIVVICTVHQHDHRGALAFAAAIGERMGEPGMVLTGPITDCTQHSVPPGLETFELIRQGMN